VQVINLLTTPRFRTSTVKLARGEYGPTACPAEGFAAGFQIISEDVRVASEAKNPMKDAKLQRRFNFFTLVFSRLGARSSVVG
jgi:hypothetical protein